MSMSCEFVNIPILPYATRAPTRRRPRFSRRGAGGKTAIGSPRDPAGWPGLAAASQMMAAIRAVAERSMTVSTSLLTTVSLIFWAAFVPALWLIGIS